MAFVTRKKRLVPADELPVRADPEVAEQRDLRAEDLGDTAAVRRRAHVRARGIRGAVAASSRRIAIASRPALGS